MKEIANIVKLDFITVKGKSFAPLILFILLAIIAAPFTFAYLISTMALFAGLAAEPAFAVSEQCGYSKLYGILPIKKHNIVFGRFTFGLILLLGVSLISIPLGYIANTLSLGENIDFFKDVALLSKSWQTSGITIELVAAFCFLSGCCLSAFEYTLLFIFGVSKQISAILGFAIGFGAIIMIILKVFNIEYYVLLQSLSITIANHRLLTMIVLYLGGIFIMALGACISNFFFCKREL